MKRSAIIVLLILSLSVMSAQVTKEINVSDKVKSELAKLFPAVKEVKWTGNSGITNAAFIHEGKQIRVIFKADTLYMTMTETEISELPEAVRNHIDKNYKGFSIIRGGKIHFATTPDKNNICYGADITDGSLVKRVLCYPDGSEMSVAPLPGGMAK